MDKPPHLALWLFGLDGKGIVGRGLRWIPPEPMAVILCMRPTRRIDSRMMGRIFGCYYRTLVGRVVFVDVVRGMVVSQFVAIGHISRASGLPLRGRTSTRLKCKKIPFITPCTRGFGISGGMWNFLYKDGRYESNQVPGSVKLMCNKKIRIAASWRGCGSYSPRAEFRNKFTDALKIAPIRSTSTPKGGLGILTQFVASCLIAPVWDISIFSRPFEGGVELCI